MQMKINNRDAGDAGDVEGFSDHVHNGYHDEVHCVRCGGKPNRRLDPEQWIDGGELEHWLPSSLLWTLGPDYEDRMFAADDIAPMVDCFRREPDRIVDVQFDTMLTNAGWFGDPKQCLDLADEILECDPKWVRGLNLSFLEQYLPYYIFPGSRERVYWNLHWHNLLCWLLSAYQERTHVPKPNWRVIAGDRHCAYADGGAV